MSTMADSKGRRPRRRFDDDFKAQAVRLVLDEGQSATAVARDLDLTRTALQNWVERVRADRRGGKTGLTTVEREELARLRKKIVSSAPSEKSQKKPPSSRSTSSEIRLDCRGEGLVRHQRALSRAGR